MRSWRENPEGEENQRATKQSEREIFALKMMAKQHDDISDQLPDGDGETPEAVARLRNPQV
jgi:hypothetical protein